MPLFHYIQHYFFYSGGIYGGGGSLASQLYKQAMEIRRCK